MQQVHELCSLHCLCALCTASGLALWPLALRLAGRPAWCFSLLPKFTLKYANQLAESLVALRCLAVW